MWVARTEQDRGTDDRPGDPGGCENRRRVRREARRERRPRAPHRGRGGPRPGGPARDPCPCGAFLQGDIRRPSPEAGGRPDHDLRPRPRRAGPGEGHRDLQHLRAPPGAVPRCRPRRLHPVERRQDHRPLQAGPAGGRLRPPPAGPGAADDADRRLPDGDPRAARRDRRRGVRAHVHVDARHPQARSEDHDFRGPRSAARPGDPFRGDEPDHGALLRRAVLRGDPAGKAPDWIATPRNRPRVEA